MNDKRCDSIDFTTKADRAGQTSGSGLGRPGRFGHQPYKLLSFLFLLLVFSMIRCPLVVFRAGLMVDEM